MNSNATLSATGSGAAKASPSTRLAQAAGVFAGGAAPITFSFKAAPASFSFDGTASMSRMLFRRSGEFRRPFAQAGARMVAGDIAAGARDRFGLDFEQDHGDGRSRQIRNTAVALDNNPGMGALDFSFGEALR